MYFGMYKNFDRELKAIKYGIRRDCYFDLYDKLLYNRDGKATINDLKNEFVKYFAKMDNLEEAKMYCNLRLTRLKNTTNNFIAILLTTLSLFLTMLIFILNVITSFMFNQLSIGISAIGISETDIKNMSNYIESNFEVASQYIAQGLIIMVVILLVGIFINYVVESRKRDSIIYYEFMESCIEHVQEKEFSENRKIRSKKR